MIKIIWALTSLFLLAGCSAVAGSQFSGLSLWFILVLIVSGCNKAGKVIFQLDNKGPASPQDPLRENYSEFLSADDLFVPDKELEEEDSGQAENSQNYRPDTGKNYFQISKRPIAGEFIGGQGKDIVVVKQEYKNSGDALPSIELGDNDDLLIFEGYHNYKGTSESIDLGTGNDGLVLGAAVLPDNVNLGSSNNKVYISRIENHSVISMNFPNDKIVLTEGLQFSDLSFLDVAEGIQIRIKETIATASEDVYVPLLTVKPSGNVTTLSDLANPANFETSNIVFANKGLYKKVGSKFPETESLVFKPDYLFEIKVRQQNVTASDICFLDTSGSSRCFDYISGTFDDTVFAGEEGTTRYLSYTAYGYFSALSTSTEYFSLEGERTISLLDNRNYQGSYFRLSPNLSFSQVKFEYTYPTTNSYFISHPQDVSDLEISGSNLLGVIELNGKLAGNILMLSNIDTVIILSRERSGAKLHPNGHSYLIHLKDNIAYSDLEFEENGNEVKIMIRDDADQKVTLLTVVGESLSFVADEDMYVPHSAI